MCHRLGTLTKSLVWGRWMSEAVKNRSQETIDVLGLGLVLLLGLRRAAILCQNNC